MKNKEEDRMIRSLDALADYEMFMTKVIPGLMDDVRAGLTDEQIYNKYKHLAAMRAVQIALLEPDSTKALAAVKEIQDRAGGKAPERKEITHKYSKLKDKELDALLKSKLAGSVVTDKNVGSN